MVDFKKKLIEQGFQEVKRVNPVLPIAMEYLAILKEISNRLNLIESLLSDDHGLGRAYAYEFSFLQLRRVCELIGLGCVFLHSNLKTIKSKKVKKEWNTHKLFACLQKEYKHVFPQSFTRSVSYKGVHIEANSKPEAMSYKKFKTLYAKSGEVLHRGSVSSMHSLGNISPEKILSVENYVAGLRALLEQHIVGLNNLEGFFIAEMNGTNGEPEITFNEVFIDGNKRGYRPFNFKWSDYYSETDNYLSKPFGRKS